ncbi:MAG: glycogen synthase [Candidatus Omnitrophota bacterium]
MTKMKILFLTNEYPPAIYGGAGIHVDYLSRELAKICTLDVRCFGNQILDNGSLQAKGYPVNTKFYTMPQPLHPVFGALQRCLDFNTANIDANLVHCHTWYTHFGGILAKKNYSIPLVITTHSLEPLRPWKREQLAGGYDFSCWVEKTALEMADAVIAVSQDTKNDILKHFNIDPKRIHIIHNGIDLDEYTHTKNPEILKSRGIDPAQPYVLFVGRITRQKGIVHLINAIKHMSPDFQIVLCAGAPDTPEIAAEMQASLNAIRKIRKGIIWIQEMVDIPTKVALYSHAAVFCCPSVYEPFGIINLEAMACQTPVVASAVGGIKEVVEEGKTGFLVPLEFNAPGFYEPKDPEKFSHDLAKKINILMKDPALCLKMGQAGRRRAEDQFSWAAIAAKTHALYQSLL